MMLVDEEQVIGLRLTTDEWIAACGLTSTIVPFVVSAMATALGVEPNGGDHEAVAAEASERAAVNSLLLRGYAHVGNPFVVIDPAVAAVVHSYQAAESVGQMVLRSSRGLEVVAEHVRGGDFDPFMLLNTGFGVEALRMRSASDSSLGDLCCDLTLQALRVGAARSPLQTTSRGTEADFGEALVNPDETTVLWMLIDAAADVEPRSLAVSSHQGRVRLSDNLQSQSPVFNDTSDQAVRECVASLLGYAAPIG